MRRTVAQQRLGFPMTREKSLPVSRRAFLVSLAAIGLAACADGPSRTSSLNTPTPDLSRYPVEPLSEEEEAGILHLREEEKLARDVYTALEQKWNLPAFSVIKESEQNHMDSVATLIDRYDLLDPAQSQPGVFTDPNIQELYEILTARGEDSTEAALRVGMTIEDLDIYDIDQILQANDNQDISTVFGHLRTGSIHHLQRFYADLQAIGGEYQPQFIAPEEFDRLVAAAP